ncbi:hypothetical protein RRF57_010475 [Xylaria bambusicola]|uniref:Uncharacterized protein n=1 Tax=Xylaria bambusicola TaxID=326684 RepID=A0AAN7Z9I9_9PEZI
MMGIARNADSRTSVLADLSDFTALKTHRDILPSHNPNTIRSHFFVLALYHGECASTTAKDSTAFRMRPYIEHGRANRHEVQRQAIPTMSRLGCQNTGINGTTHTVQ